MEYRTKRQRLSGATKFKLQTAQTITDYQHWCDNRGVIATAVEAWKRARKMKGGKMRDPGNEVD